MNKQEAIKTLKEANEWRRWGEWEMIDPKAFWIAIDFAINELENLN